MASFSGFEAGDPFLLDLDDGKRELVGADGARSLLEKALEGRELSTLTKVRLSNKSYDVEAAEVVAAALKECSSLVEVDFSDMIAGRHEDIALQVLETICQSVAGRALQHIDLSDNAMGEKGVNACRGALENQSGLLSLAFCNDGLSASAMEAVRDIVASVDSLRRLHFYNNMSGDGGARAVADVLAHSCDLTDLRFSGTRAGTPGSLAVAEALTRCPAVQCGRLTKLDLADNTFGEEGGEMLATALESQEQLVSLSLRDGGLEDGVIAVAEALMKVQSNCLTELDLSGNDISKEAIDSVCRCVATKSKLTYLGLEENEIKTSGALKVARCVRGLTKLRKVQLSQNEIGTRGAVAVVKAVKGLESLECLELNANGLSEEGLAMINRVLESYGMQSVLGDMDDNDPDFEDDDDDEDVEDEEAGAEGQEESSGAGGEGEQREEQVEELADLLAGVSVSSKPNN